jgi:hypothetical protein
MAWLDTQFAAAETANDSPNVAGIQQAIWDLGNQISGLSFTYTDPTTVAWVNDAIANYGAQSVAFYSQFSVLIPSSPDTVSGAALPITDVGGSTPTGTPQFFMVEVGDTPPVPEPATFVLIGSGLLFFGLFKRRKSA